ncbi:hypothetical protein PRtIB026_A40640 [Pseudomonas sp. RtIB026]|nr:hypothetical protein PRtIB026_A40640 [Pseudomonas sp. RtIB026]
MPTMKPLAFLVAMSAASSAFAAMTASIEIVGNVVPTACGIVASQTKLDLGGIQPDSTGKVPEIIRPLGTVSVTCAAPTQMNIGVTTSGAMTGNPVVPAAWSQGGKDLSAFWLLPMRVTVDGANGSLFYSSSNTGDSWSTLDPNNFIPTSAAATNTRISFFPAAGGITPSAITNASFDLNAKFHEIPKVDFSKGEITAAQTLTFTLKYL